MKPYNCSASTEGEVGHESSYKQLNYNDHEVEDGIYHGQNENVTGESCAESGKSVEENTLKAHNRKALKSSKYNEMSGEESYNECYNAGDEVTYYHGYDTCESNGCEQAAAADG